MDAREVFKPGSWTPNKEKAVKFYFKHSHHWLKRPHHCESNEKFFSENAIIYPALIIKRMHSLTWKQIAKETGLSSQEAAMARYKRALWWIGRIDDHWFPYHPNGLQHFFDLLKS